MDQDCIFCKIVKGEIPTEKIYENEDVIAFNDIHPSAPKHILVVPKKHIATLNDAKSDDEKILSRMLFAAKDLAKNLGMEKDGYRTVINVNRGAGQVVFHLHMHVIGGRKLGIMG